MSPLLPPFKVSFALDPEGQSGSPILVTIRQMDLLPPQLRPVGAILQRTLYYRVGWHVP